MKRGWKKGDPYHDKEHDEIYDRVWNVRDFGAKGDGTANDSAAFQAALDAAAGRYPLRVPAGTYAVESLSPPPGTRIVAEPGASIRGVGEASALFVTSGSASDIRIHGGRWGACAAIWRHSGSSALSEVRFEDMAIAGARVAFDLSAAIRVFWRDCAFASASGFPFESGVVFAGADQSNANSIEGCDFRQYTGWAVHLMDTASVNVGNSIRLCRFENSAGGGAVRIGANAQLTVLSECYLEYAGGAEYADIAIDGGETGYTRQAVVRDCAFGPPSAGQPAERLTITNRAAARVEGCIVTLLQGDVLAHCDHASSETVVLRANVFRAEGSGTYEERAYRLAGAGSVLCEPF